MLVLASFALISVFCECSSYHALFVSSELRDDPVVEPCLPLLSEKSELLLVERADFALLIRDSGDGMLVTSGPSVGRQTVAVEAAHSIVAHIMLLSVTPTRLSTA